MAAIAGPACMQQSPSRAPTWSGSLPLDPCPRPEEGCPCEPESAPVRCYLPAEDRGDSILCGRGTRYCRDGIWSACEAIERYEAEVQPARAALVTGPTPCNACNPDCAISVDRPTSADLTPSRSSGVAYDPARGGISLPPSMGGGPLTDRDGDGVPDAADDFPDDRTRWHSAGGGYFRILPFGAPPVYDPLNFTARVTTADVYFLMDTTGSMGGEISNLRSSLTSGTLIAGCPGGLIGAIRCTIPNAWFGVGRHDDYPVHPYGDAGWGDRVFQHLLDIQPDTAAAQTAVNSLGTRAGYDWPESQSQALFAVATGSGLGGYLPARTGCPAGRWGYPCFRPDTIPIIILFTDAPYHNGPNTAYNYSASALGFTPPSWATVVSALNARRVRTIVVESSGGYADARANARDLCNATGSVDAAGNPYVFSISTDGSGLSSAVVTAVQALANATRYDVSARATDNPATMIDERRFVQSITPVRWGPGSCLGIVGSTFRQCSPGTHVEFSIAFRNDFVMPIAVPQVFNFFIEVLLDGTVQQQIPVRIVVPPAVSTYPPEGSYWRDYDATAFCTIPPQRPDWNALRWDTILPAGTSIRFEIRTADSAAMLSSAPPVSVTLPPEPAVGSVDVGALLVGSGQRNFLPYLRVTSVLMSSPDRLSAPVLRGFELEYTCTTAE
ncbi:MAG: hypothetical protein NZ898_05875 [Myxococcota bacterium]|nr:hypothetical protein [Myxococcota bacterium]MDW8361459.1 hypothetical protein [Myxococcales bacterium]